MMDCRYVEVFEANALDVEKAKEREGGDDGRGGRGGRSSGYTVQLRGLPFRVSEQEIAEWFSSVADPVDVCIHYNAQGR